MKRVQRETRQIVLKCPVELAAEVQSLSEFNCISVTEFVVTSMELMLEHLYTQCPELENIPLVELRTRSCESGATLYADDEPEEVLLAAEDEN